MSKIKVGFIIQKYKSLATKFNSGSEQNTYHLVSLFKSIHEFDVSYVLTEKNSLYESLQNQKALNDDTPLVELESLDPKLSNPIVYDILIHIETYLPNYFIKQIKERFSTRFVNFIAGIAMWGLMEDIIYDVENRFVSAIPQYSLGVIDEYWMSPHHAYQKTYLETITKSHISISPYIYEPYFLKKVEEARKKINPDFDPYYKPTKQKNIGILEPNINLVKNAIIPACIVEFLYCQDSSLLNGKLVEIFASDHLFKRQAFQHLFNYFNSKSIFTSEKRYRIVDILHSDCNIIISHQHLCELNYLYLDAFYYQIPLIHNSDMLKDYGYYYPDFNVKDGAKALKRALQEHDLHLEEYAEKSQEVLLQFSIRNKQNINSYQEIIQSLLVR